MNFYKYTYALIIFPLVLIFPVPPFYLQYCACKKFKEFSFFTWDYDLLMFELLCFCCLCFGFSCIWLHEKSSYTLCLVSNVVHGMDNIMGKKSYTKLPFLFWNGNISSEQLPNLTCSYILQIMQVTYISITDDMLIAAYFISHILV